MPVITMEEVKRIVHPLRKENRRGQLLRVAQMAARDSGGRLRLACDGNGHFLELDGQRIGRDIEHYADFGDTARGWRVGLIQFSYDVFLCLREKHPGCITEAGRELLKLGEEVYSEAVLDHWKNIF